MAILEIFNCTQKMFPVKSDKNTWWIELLKLNNNTWNHLTVWKKYLKWLILKITEPFDVLRVRLIWIWW